MAKPLTKATFIDETAAELAVLTVSISIDCQYDEVTQIDMPGSFAVTLTSVEMFEALPYSIEHVFEECSINKDLSSWN